MCYSVFTQASDPEDEGEPDEEVAIPFPDLMDIGKAFELGAVSIIIF